MIHRQARRLWLKDWRNAALYFTAVWGMIGVGAFLAVYVAREAWHLVPLAVVYTGMWAVVFWLLQRYRYAPLLRRVMREHGFDVCIRCGYRLQEVGNSRSPGTTRLTRPQSRACSADR